MIWPQRHRETPTDLEAVQRDMKVARAALEQVERATEKSRSRWPLIRRTVAILEEIRDTNHLAEDLHTIFTSQRS